MLRKRNHILVVLLIVALMLTFTGCANQTAASAPAPVAEESKYPEKPITVLVGFNPGGGSDQLAQLTNPFLNKYLETPITNIYKPGATGAIAWTELAKQSKNNGYTISVTNTPMLMTNYIMNDDITYTIDELTPLVNVLTDPGVIAVGKDSPFKTYEDFAKAVKESPGTVTVGNSGTGGDDFFTTLLWEKASGLKVQMVPFQGDGPSYQAAQGGKIDASFTNLGVVYAQVQAGNIRLLATFTKERSGLVPDVRTMKEIGYDVVAGSSRGYSAPKGIPDDVKAKLLEAFEKTFKDPEFLENIAKLGQEPDILIGDDYAKYLKDNEKEFITIWDEVKDQVTK